MGFVHPQKLRRSNEPRVPHISPVFGEMWDSKVLRNNLQIRRGVTRSQDPSAENESLEW
jgi:hypothetical protein